MKTLRRIAALLFCTGLLFSASSCAVAVPTGNDGYNNGNRHSYHERRYERRHERHERHDGLFSDPDGRREH